MSYTPDPSMLLDPNTGLGASAPPSPVQPPDPPPTGAVPGAPPQAPNDPMVSMFVNSLRGAPAQQTPQGPASPAATMLNALTTKPIATGNPAANSQPGLLKKMLLNFVYTGGETLKHSLGMPTDQELQSQAQQRQQQQLTLTMAMRKQQMDEQNQKSEMEYRALQGKKIQADLDAPASPDVPKDETQLYYAAASGDPKAQAAAVALAKAKADAETAKNANKAPEIKTIAGRDMQWNPKTGTWDDKGPHKAEKDTSNVGTWQITQDENGKPIIFNSKTAMVKPAPSGAIDKQTAKELSTQYGIVQDAQSRYNKMLADIDAIKKNPANAGSYDMDLLSNHIAMTFGTVKGVRTGRDLILHHVAARSLDEATQVLGQRVLNGGQLSDAQRQNFLHLGVTTLGEAQRKYNALRGYHGQAPPASSTPPNIINTDPHGWQ